MPRMSNLPTCSRQPPLLLLELVRTNAGEVATGHHNSSNFQWQLYWSGGRNTDAFCGKYRGGTRTKAEENGEAEKEGEDSGGWGSSGGRSSTVTTATTTVRSEYWRPRSNISHYVIALDSERSLVVQVLVWRIYSLAETVRKESGPNSVSFLVVWSKKSSIDRVTDQIKPELLPIQRTEAVSGARSWVGDANSLIVDSGRPKWIMGICCATREKYWDN